MRDLKNEDQFKNVSRFISVVQGLVERYNALDKADEVGREKGRVNLVLLNKEYEKDPEGFLSRHEAELDAWRAREALKESSSER